MKKKKIDRPENWQDFEDLCKLLWGEIWEIPNTITKNGRLGQSQHGVDISGRPKFTNKYWGIQCKDKDSYTNAKLTEDEIRSEVEKAKLFKPDLETYIIASTATKNAKIEQFVRELNLKNIEESSFEIILFCWEDIVDLLYRHPTVLKWYHGLNHWQKHDFKISFNQFEDNLTLKPKLKKEITRYIISNKTHSEIMLEKLSSQTDFQPIDFKEFFFPHQDMVNKSWVNFDLIMENTGSVVIEDWYFTIKFLEGVKKIDDGSSLYFQPLDLKKNINNKTKTITYTPLRNFSLVQKDNEYFEISILPEIGTTKIVAEWQIIARDFDKEGTVEINLEPEYIELVQYEELPFNSDIQGDVVNVYYLVEKVK